MARNSYNNEAARAYIAMRDKYGVAIPFRTNNENIEKERARHAQALVLIAKGKLEEARRIYWWPKNENPPTGTHWSYKPVHYCFCGRKSPDGILALCAYCTGITPETPSLIPRVAR